MDPADLELACGHEGNCYTACEDADREAVGSGVHSRNRLVDIVKRRQTHDGPEHLLATERRRGVDIGKQGRRHDGADPFASHETARTVVHSHFDPGCDALGRVLADNRPDGGGFIAGIAESQLRNEVRQPPLDLRQYGTLDKQHLDRRANLPRLAETRGDDLRQRSIQVRVGADDAMRQRPQLHLGTAQPGTRLDRTPRLRASGECDEPYGRLVKQPVHDVRPAMHDGDQAGRKPGLDQRFRQNAGCERRMERRLEHDRIACRKSRGDLVRDRIQRRIEGRDRAHDTKRHAQGEADPAGLAGGALDRHHLADKTPRLFRRQPERRNAAGDLAEGILPREPRLPAQELHQLIPTGFDQPGRRVENEAAAVIVEGLSPERVLRRGHAVHDLLPRRQMHLPALDQMILVVNRDRCAA